MNAFININNNISAFQHVTFFGLLLYDKELFLCLDKHLGLSVRFVMFLK